MRGRMCGIIACAMLAILAGCGGEPGQPVAEGGESTDGANTPTARAPETSETGPASSDAKRADGAQDADADANADGKEAPVIGTPMEDRVATLGVLNKRNNVSQDITLKPGGVQRIGNVEVRLSACERTAPWEVPQETGAFVQIIVRDTATDRWSTEFSGWLFRDSPSLNVVEHPIYDVWVKDCAMRFPGEEPSREASSQTES